MGVERVIVADDADELHDVWGEALSVTDMFMVGLIALILREYGTYPGAFTVILWTPTGTKRLNGEFPTGFPSKYTVEFSTLETTVIFDFKRGRLTDTLMVSFGPISMCLLTFPYWDVYLLAEKDST